jgi:homogentisate 1,2-dioxygenase
MTSVTDCNNRLTYLSGLNNYHYTEAVPGALPKTQNSPQQAPLGLYTEQISGSAFTTPRDQTKFSWCYRIQPSVVHEPFQEHNINTPNTWTNPPYNTKQSPNQYRWSPEYNPAYNPANKTNFITGVKTICGYGDPKTLQGATANIFFANQSMSDNNNNLYFSNHDAELLIVMQSGSALFITEFGKLIVTADDNNSEIIVIPRGVRFKVDLITPTIQGYMAENFGSPFVLPELGAIGANGLANARHFMYPTADYEDLNNNSNNKHKWICKYQGKFWQAELKSSPCNIVSWHGNYAPYKYNLDLFNTINTVSFDHPDPSIFTVLTSPSPQIGVANLDFVIFPPRWMVGEHTFRPPYFHRNIMSEFMGLIRGVYDAKSEGFTPGGCSLHNRMSPHGPDTNTVLLAEKSKLGAEKFQNTLAFMFESNMAWDVTDYALQSKYLQNDYYQCWQELPARFGV